MPPGEPEGVTVFDEFVNWISVAKRVMKVPLSASLREEARVYRQCGYFRSTEMTLIMI